MEYIQCTNCSKKYAANDKVRAAAGKRIKCKACNQTFPIVIYDSASDSGKPREQANPEATLGWHPAKTMPATEKPKPTPSPKKDSEQPESEEGGDDELALLRAVAQKKNKQRQLYITIGLGLCLLVGVALLYLMGDGDVVVAPVAPQERARQQTEVVVNKDSDHDSEQCRQAAAEQWMIDFRVMNTEYSSQEYVRMLEQSQAQSAQVREVCANVQVVAEILQSATAKQKPLWFAAEIRALQGDVYAEAVGEPDFSTGNGDE